MLCSKLLQSCPTLCDPMDCGLPNSYVHGIVQARIPEWVAISSSRGSFQPRDWTHVSHISCIGSLGSLPLVPPRYLGLNLIYFIRENTFSTNLSSILFFFFEQINVSFLPLQRYCNREEPWLHIDSVPLRLMLCCQCLEMLALHLL